jgi:hypothetical protein
MALEERANASVSDSGAFEPRAQCDRKQASTGRTDERLGFRKERLTSRRELGVEGARNLARELEVLLLVLADGDVRAPERKETIQRQSAFR